MRIETFTYNCSGCGKCVENCPRGVLTLVDNGLCRFVNVADSDLCFGCKRCERHCPNKAIKIEKTNKKQCVKHRNMKNKFRFIILAIGGIAIMALIIAIIMYLWNWIIPSVTGWNSINYWQALGLALLFRLLTGRLTPSFPSFKRRGDLHKMHNMHNMSITEKKAFIRRQLSKLSSDEISNE